MLNKIKVFLEMIKFEHTIFALPFAFLGGILGGFYATKGWPTWQQIVWITLAMVGARTAAMGLNRLIDMKIDRKNPRTAKRALPSGLLGVTEVIAYILVSFVVMGVSAYQLNLLCLELMPIAVFFLCLYSYTKRFTWLCHIVLGVAIGLSPMGAWIALTGSFNLPGVILAIAVATWIAGFDVIYSCQDVDFDREHRLHSIPVHFGLAGALQISAALHLVTATLLLLTGFLLGLGLFYFIGVMIALVLLFKQHKIISPNDLSSLNFAFFNMNGYLSVAIFVFAVLDRILPIKIFQGGAL